MSARNGDKARFGKQRKRKMAQRLKIRAMREDLRPAEGSGAEAAQGEHHGVLDHAAEAVGSALGTLAAKVKRAKRPQPATAE